MDISLSKARKWFRRSRDVQSKQLVKLTCVYTVAKTWKYCDKKMRNVLSTNEMGASKAEATRFPVKTT